MVAAVAPAEIVTLPAKDLRSASFVAVPPAVYFTVSGAVTVPVRLTVNVPVVRPASVAEGSVAVIVTTVVFEIVTVRVAIATPPAESVTRAVSVHEPLGDAVVFQAKPLFVPAYTVLVPAAVEAVTEYV